ncbi:MAG: fumarylacetoacetase [Flavobacteriaceae bacterium]
MSIRANDPKLTSWLPVETTSDFPIQNIPFGVFLTPEDVITIGSRIGDYAIDLGALHQLGYFQDIPLTDDIFLQDTLNDFISDGKKTWRLVRNRISEIFEASNPELRDQKAHREVVLFTMLEVEMKLPVQIGDYTDFYSSKEHATNIGKMFRDPENALLPNWLHIPVGYHGRSSTIVPSGTPIKRPKGQTIPKGADQPVFGPSKMVDFELEMAFITTDANAMGEAISIDQAEDHIFGLVLFNDWSARDIQKWEYVPLGPFLGKNFASSISAWIVTLDALEPFRVESPGQDPKPLPYLHHNGNNSFDIHLEAIIETPDGSSTTVTRSNFKYMYWSMAQQLAHHTVNGCKVNSGDMMGSGTISGTGEESFGSMLELAWQGTKPLALTNGDTRTSILDHDTVVMKGYCSREGHRIGFGEVRTLLLPA